jgi:hypothetical protein
VFVRALLIERTSTMSDMLLMDGETGIGLAMALDGPDAIRWLVKSTIILANCLFAPDHDLRNLIKPAIPESDGGSRAAKITSRLGGNMMNPLKRRGALRLLGLAACIGAMAGLSGPLAEDAQAQDRK